MTNHKEPEWFKCTRSNHPLFTKGVAYEVAEYREGAPIVATNHTRQCRSLPVSGVSFEPHDPWAHLRSKSDDE